MLCPICKSELILGEGKKRYETLVEHVEDPNGIPCEKPYYICSNNKCESRAIVYWDEDGESYITGKNYFEIKDKYHSLTPYDSFQKKMDIEVYKHDEDFIVLNLFFMRWKCEFSYEADTWGNITKRIPKIKAYYRDKNGNICYYISGAHMFFYRVNSFKRILDRYNKNPNNKYVIDDIRKEFINPDWDHRLYSLLFNWWVNAKYKNIRNYLKLDELLSK